MWESARKMLVAALESEVEEFMQKHRHELDYDGHRTVGINGYMPDCSDFRMPWGNSGNRRKYSGTGFIKRAAMSWIKILIAYSRRLKGFEKLQLVK